MAAPLDHEKPQGVPPPARLCLVGSVWECQVGETGQGVEREEGWGGAVALVCGVPVVVGCAAEAEACVWIWQLLMGHWEASAAAGEALCCPSVPRQDQAPNRRHLRSRHHRRHRHRCPRGPDLPIRPRQIG